MYDAWRPKQHLDQRGVGLEGRDNYGVVETHLGINVAISVSHARTRADSTMRSLSAGHHMVGALPGGIIRCVSTEHRIRRSSADSNIAEGVKTTVTGIASHSRRPRRLHLKSVSDIAQRAKAEGGCTLSIPAAPD